MILVSCLNPTWSREIPIGHTTQVFFWIDSYSFLPSFNSQRPPGTSWFVDPAFSRCLLAIIVSGIWSPERAAPSFVWDCNSPVWADTWRQSAKWPTDTSEEEGFRGCWCSWSPESPCDFTSEDINLPQTSQYCSPNALRSAAQSRHQVQMPSYLNGKGWAGCEGIWC